MRARMMEPAGLHRGNPPRPTAHTTTASRSLLSVIVLYPWASSGDLRAAPAAPPRAQWSPRLAPCPRAKLACQIPAGPNTCRAKYLPGSDEAYRLPQARSAVATTNSSLAHCSSSARTLPPATLAKPHCVDNPSCSMGRTRAAASMRRSRSSCPSSCRVLEETRPSTAVLCLGRKRNGRKSPARAVVLQSEGIDRRLREELLRHRLVAARRHPTAAKVSAAKVEAEPHVGRSIGGDTSQQGNVGLEQGHRIATLHLALPAHVRVAQHG